MCDAQIQINFLNLSPFVIGAVCQTQEVEVILSESFVASAFVFQPQQPPCISGSAYGLLNESSSTFVNNKSFLTKQIKIVRASLRNAGKRVAKIYISEMMLSYEKDK